MSSTPRLALPFLTPGQAQKEYFHNEACSSLIRWLRRQSKAGR